MANRVGVQWRLVHQLAAELALNRVSKNLVQDVIAYLRVYPETPLLDYAARLKQVSDGGYFQSGKSGPYERVDLYNALTRLPIADEANPVLQLSWIARLIEYYTQEKARAARASGLSLHQPRRGEHLKGVVREQSRGTAWVQVASGQWGKARRGLNADIGDEVAVEVTQVRSPVEFEVNITRVTHPAVTQVPATPEPAKETLLIEVSEERSEQISEAASNFMDFLRNKWKTQEEDT